MKAVPGILPTLLEMIYFFSTPTIDVEPIFLVKPMLSHKLVPIAHHKDEQDDQG
mgnify:FL=1